MNLASIIDSHPDDHSAVISRGKATTYGELRDQTARLRGGLIGLGIEPGDRVALVCSSNWYFVVSYLAVLGVGAIAVPINPLSPSRALQKQIAGIGAKAAVVGPSARGAVARMDRKTLSELKFVITTDDQGGAGEVALTDLLGNEPVPVVDRTEDDVAVLMYTSGTAGAPKPAMLSHGNLLSNIEQVLSLSGLQREIGDVSLCVLPLFHIMGLNSILGVGLRSGSSVLLMERFDPLSALEAIERNKVSIIAGAPAMWAAWASLLGVDSKSFETVRIATSGAAALAPEVADRMRARFGLTIVQGYGLTEASPAVTSGIGLPLKPGSIGAPLEGVEMRLVDQDGDDVLVGDEGEIWVRGPNVFLGYWQDQVSTETVLTPDKWLRTGDVGVVDDDGFLFLVDRVKDLIIVSGFNVFPAEVEAVLLEHPAVRDCAVVGVAHPYSGEAVKAFVVVETSMSIEEDDVISFCANHLPRYKCPEKVLFVEEVPHGLAGKILRRELRDPVVSPS